MPYYQIYIVFLPYNQRSIKEVMNEIIIDEQELLNISEMTVPEYNSKGEMVNKSCKYLDESIRVKIDRLYDIAYCNRSTQLIYFYILDCLKKNTNVIKIERINFEKVLNFDKGTISKAIKSLVENKFIQIVDKDTYKIPIDQTFKGNIDTIIKKDKERKEEERRYKLEQENKNRTEYLSNLRKLKLKAKLLKH